MKKKFLPTFLIVFVALLGASFAAAQELPLQVKLARVLAYQKKYDEALAAYKKFTDRNPHAYFAIFEAAEVNFWKGDHATALELYLAAASDAKLAPKAYYQAGYMQLILGRFGDAAESFRKSLELKPDNSEAKLQLARVLSYDKKFAESVDEYNLLLMTEPANFAALHEKADVLSWDERYVESINAYDKALETKFEPDVARQKARVLGWWKKYSRSLKSYQEAFEKSGDENIKLEMRGKKAYWNKWVRTAIRRYENLLKSEPKNNEARFDLAQTEAYQRNWQLAKKDFALLLDNESGHFRARDSLDKLREQTRPYVVPEVRYFRAKSGEFETHVNHLQAGITLGEAFNENFEIFAGYAFDTYFYNNYSRILRDRGKIGVGLYWPMNLWVNAAYIPIRYNGIHRLSHNFETSVSSKPFDPVTVTAFVNRTDLDSNHTVFVDKLHTTDFGGRAQIDVNRRLTLNADGAYSRLNDKNRKKSIGGDALIFLSYEPMRLSLDARFDYYGYDFVTPVYWSPKNFWNVSGTLHWRHYLNKHGLYYGALDTFYGLKYRFQVDKNHNVYNGGAAELHHEFSHKTAINIEINGLYSSVYDDFGAFATLTQRF